MNADTIAEAYQAIRSEVGPTVTVVAATKYVPPHEMVVLAEAGIEVVGENRVQEMQRKHELHGDRFRWHFIGALQSNKTFLSEAFPHGLWANRLPASPFRRPSAKTT